MRFDNECSIACLNVNSEINHYERRIGYTVVTKYNVFYELFY